MRPLVFMSAALLLFLAACAQVPKVDYLPVPASAEDVHSSPVALSRVKLDIPLGAEVGAVSSDRVFCGWPHTAASRTVLQDAVDKEGFKDAFGDALGGQGYDVVGRSDLMFDEEEEELRSEYKVAARITQVSLSACGKDYETFGGLPFGRAGIMGELFMAVDWTVYDNLRRVTVYKASSSGYTNLKIPNQEGLELMMAGAFEMASHNLGVDPAFRNLLFFGKKPPPLKREPFEDRPRTFDPREEVVLERKPLSEIPFSRHVDQSRKVAVLVQAGAGHGSGFFIDPRGYILTNRHVVGDAQRVRVVMADRKKALVGEVLRTARIRDVALIRLEDMPPNLKIVTLPVRVDWPHVSEEVYAIGAPLTKRLQDSVTKGIVSAHRKKFKIDGAAQDFIQADVAIHGGNSGGPLLDVNGNIAGLSVAGIGLSDDPLNTSLNLFIPIAQALEDLDISIRE